MSMVGKFMEYHTGLACRRTGFQARMLTSLTAINF
jgi:hypothetical protein